MCMRGHLHPLVLAIIIGLGARADAAPAKVPYYGLVELYSVEADSIVEIGKDGFGRVLQFDPAAPPALREIAGASFRVGDREVPLGNAPSVVSGFVLNGVPQARWVAMPSPFPLGYKNPNQMEGGLLGSFKVLFGLEQTGDGDAVCTVSLTNPETAPLSAQIPVGDGERHAFVSPAGVEENRLLLILLRVYQPGSAVDPDRILEGEWRFSVETKFIQVVGKPDWTYWAKSYGRAYEFPEGAGRVFGPVDARDFVKVSSVMSPWGSIGFPEVTDDDTHVFTSPRVTSQVDHQKLQREGKTMTDFSFVVTNGGGAASRPPAGKKYLNLSDYVGDIYNGLALHPKKLGREDVRGRAMATSVNFTLDENGNTILPSPDLIDGFIEFVGADSTEQTGVYRLDQKWLIRMREMTKTWTSWKQGPNAFHAQFRCAVDVRDGDSIAYLVPGVDDKYLLLVSTFTLIPNARKPMTTMREYDIGMKVVLVDGEPDWEAIDALDRPDALELRDGSPVVFWPQNPYGFWNADRMESEPQRYYFKRITTSKLVWDSRIPRDKESKSKPIGESFWTTYPNALSPVGYRVPFSHEEQARAKLLLGVQMSGPTITDTDPGDPRHRGILGAYQSADPVEFGRTPPRLDEFIQFQLPVDLESTYPRTGEEMFYSRSDASYKPHDNLLTVYLFPAGKSKYFLILTRFTMNSGVSLQARGWRD